MVHLPLPEDQKTNSALRVDEVARLARGEPIMTQNSIPSH